MGDRRATAIRDQPRLAKVCRLWACIPEEEESCFHDCGSANKFIRGDLRSVGYEEESVIGEKINDVWWSWGYIMDTTKTELTNLKNMVDSGMLQVYPSLILDKESVDKHVK